MERISALRKSGTEGIMRIAVCEDEAAQRQLLGGYVQEWAEETQVRTDVAFFDSGERWES